MSKGNTSKQFTNIEAIVKGTLSGDTLLVTRPKKSPATDKIISIANVKCPQMGRANKEDEPEEPFAFKAREHIRQACIGQLVKLSLQYTNPKSRRDFCKVMVGKTDLGLSLLENGLGWINYKRSNEKDEYDHAQERAKEQSLGIWGSKKQLDAGARSVFWLGHDTDKIFKSYNKKKIKAIVEYVVTGSQLKVLLPTNDIVTLHMTGVQCNGFKYEVIGAKKGNATTEKTNEGGEEKKKEKKKKIPLPYAEEAREFTESKLLNRDIELIIEGVDKFDNFYGTVLLNGNPFQLDLLKLGYAKISEWNISQAKHVKKIRDAETKAKVKKIGLFKGYKAPKTSLKKSDSKLQQVQIIELLSGDSLRVYNETTKQEEKLYLSSVRCTRLGYRKKESEPYAYEAKELLRKKCAGKKITVKVDYRRTFAPKQQKDDKKSKDNNNVEEKKVDDQKTKKKNGKITAIVANSKKEEERLYVTVYANGKNVAVDLVSAGLATVIRHKTGEERSSNYDKLMSSEIDAERKRKGIHSGNRNPDIYRINDITFEPSSKTEKYMASLKDRKLKGIVEKVHSGSRMKVWIPSQSLLITFAISGVSSPSLGKKGTNGDDDSKKDDGKKGLHEYALEAKDYTNQNLILREVFVEIDFCDKYGTFLGQLTTQKKDYGVQLVKAGYGLLNGSAHRLPNAQEIEQAEAFAIKQHKNLYSLPEQVRDPRGYQRKQERQAYLAGAKADRLKRQQDYEDQQSNNSNSHGDVQASKQRTPMKIRITEVINSTHFYLQTSNSGEELEKIEEYIGELGLDDNDNKSSNTEWTPKSGDFCLCLYSVDESWYRAKVTSVVEGDKKKGTKTLYKVFYIDFGNTELVGVESLRPMTGPTKLLNIKAQAKEAFLAFVKEAPKQYQEVADDYVRNFTFDQDLVATHEYTDRKRIYLTIYNMDKKNLNVSLIKNGLAFVTDDPKIKKNFKDSYDEHNDAQNYAINHKVYLWEKGEIYGVEDEK